MLGKHLLGLYSFLKALAYSFFHLNFKLKLAHFTGSDKPKLEWIS